jgi:hypothetical protein
MTGKQLAIFLRVSFAKAFRLHGGLSSEYMNRKPETNLPRQQDGSKRLGQALHIDELDLVYG